MNKKHAMNKKPAMNRILFISRDPGGTNQLVALYDILQRQQNHILFDNLDLCPGPEITVIAKDYAGEIWLQNGISYQDWPDLKTEDDLLHFLTAPGPVQIVTGTSHVDDRTEQMVWRIARRLGIKTTAFLDSDRNIATRFRDDGGEVILPDQVSVLDENSVQAILSLGLDRSAIFISGDLYDRYVKSTATGGMIPEVAAEWQAKEGEGLILFASSYICEMQAMGVAFDVTEFDGLDCLIDLLISGDITAYQKDIEKPYRLIIRPHPKDTPGKYEGYRDRATENLAIVIDNSGTSLEAVGSSHMVAGMESAVLKEAEMLGVATLELGAIVRNRKGHKRTVS